MCIRLKTTGYSTYTYEAIKALGKLEPEYAQDIIPNDNLRTP